MNRRDFLRAAGMGAIVVATPAWLEYLERLLYHRRFWQVGVNLSGGGLVPVVGQPGLFQDANTGECLNIRDFDISDKYDTIYIPAGPPASDSLFSFAQIEERNKRRGFTETANGYFQEAALDAAIQRIKRGG
jgi:hypothetical protein